jgi:hypothetical protein
MICLLPPPALMTIHLFTKPPMMYIPSLPKLLASLKTLQSILLQTTHHTQATLVQTEAAEPPPYGCTGAGKRRL